MRSINDRSSCVKALTDEFGRCAQKQPMFNVSMEEAREGAVFPGVVLSVLKILGKCLRLRVNPAHISAVAHSGGLLLACCQEEWEKKEARRREKKHIDRESTPKRTCASRMRLGKSVPAHPGSETFFAFTRLD